MFGSSVISALADSPNVTVRAMVRDVESFTPVAENVVPVYGDMDRPDTLAAAIGESTDVFLVSPMDDRIAERETNVIDAVAKVGGNARVLKLHGAVEHRGDPLSQLHQRSIDRLHQTGLPWTLICPTSVMETCFLPLAETIKNGMLLGTSDHGTVGFVAVADVGEATAKVVEFGGFEGKRVMLTGPQALDMYQVAETFTEVLGKKVTYTDMTEDDYADLLISVGAFPDRDAVDLGVLCHYRAWKRGDASLVADGFEQVTGKQPTSLAQWIALNADAFR